MASAKSPDELWPRFFTSSSHQLQEGMTVELVGLTRNWWVNGEECIVQNGEGPCTGRVTVRMCSSGQDLAVKEENCKPKGEYSNFPFGFSNSDGPKAQMPPICDGDPKDIDGLPDVLQRMIRVDSARRFEWFTLNDAGCGRTWCSFVQPNMEELNNGLPLFHP